MAQADNAGALAAPPPMTGAPLLLTAFALALGTFMQVLDTSIANVSIPTIAGDLGVSADQGTWVITSFAVANGISVPLSGWLMGRYGVVKTFCASVALFTAASFLCGVAWNLPVLVIFRILQGAVSGPMIPGSQALLISIFPANQRGAAAVKQRKHAADRDTSRAPRDQSTLFERRRRPRYLALAPLTPPRKRQ